MEISFEDMDFGKLEATVWHQTGLVFLEAMGRILEAMDNCLATVRDKKRYKIREMEEREIETLVGVVRFRRRSYRDVCTGECVHLLDRKLKVKEYQRISEGVARVGIGS